MTISGSSRFLLVYGTQTGQAKAIAEEIAERAEKLSLQPDLHCFGKIEKEFSLEKERFVIIVTSTTGDGEPPETVQKFWRRIKRRTLPSDHFSNMSYTLLGLGDSNYSNFCNCGKMMDKRLLELGARQFMPSGFADDAVGLEVVVEPWINNLLSALQTLFSVVPGAANNTDLTRSVLPSIEKLALTDNQEHPLGKQGLPTTDSVESPEHVKRGDNPITSDNCSEESLDLVTVHSVTVTAIPASAAFREDSPDVAIINAEVVKHVNSAKQNDSQTGDPVLAKHSVLPTDHLQSITFSSAKGVSVGLPADTNLQATSDGSLSDCLLDWIHGIPCDDGIVLSLPIVPTSYLDLCYRPELLSSLTVQPLQNNCKLPFAASAVLELPILSIVRLTRDASLKTTFLVELENKDALVYKPGDSFSIIARNDSREVNWLLQRLGLADKADVPVVLAVQSDTVKKRAQVPEFINNPGTLRSIFTECLDIRHAPKKAFLRLLATHTGDSVERKRLLMLSSPQGSATYQKVIMEEQRGFLDILFAFKSCQPPVECLLENLTRLLPRPYSFSSDPSSGTVAFVFNVIQLRDLKPITGRQGLVTGFFDRISHLDPAARPKVQVFARSQQHFHLPSDTKTPVIAIGPGTGVAPFIGFLKHRERSMSLGITHGPFRLYFGNRNQRSDFLFEEELQRHLSLGTLSHLHACFSRDGSDGPKYVTELLTLDAAELAQDIMINQAFIYVCGSSQMAKDVHSTISKIVSSEKGLTQDEVITLMKALREERRYLEDVWC